MRLSEWRAQAPNKQAMDRPVLAVVESVIGSLGAEADPTLWVAWGDDPAQRYSVMVPTPAGLIISHVRVNVPGEGPRATGKIVRWPRVSIGELSLETQSKHRFVSTQVEGVVLSGVDEDADQIAAFVLALYAAVDGRPIPDSARRGRPSSNGATVRKTASGSKPTARTASARARSAGPKG